MPLSASVTQRSSTGGAKMQTKLSSWTPLNNQLSNSKVFGERRKLLAKWFDRWSDSQRKAVLQDCVRSCSVEQLMFLSLSVSGRLPLQAADFTCLLPRALCLYLFSFLDPRSLCRCAQVSWHWRSIVELDQLWMPKCARLGWCNFSPSLLQQGAWKRNYIHSVQELWLSSLQTASLQQQPVVPGVRDSGHEDQSEPACISEERSGSAAQPPGNTCRFGVRKEKQPAELPPWRGSDRHPKDTWRFNYLDNLEPSEQAVRGRVNSRASARRSTTAEPGDGSHRTLSEAHYKLRKAKSLMFLSSNCRAQHPPPPPPHPPPPPSPPHHHHHHHHHRTQSCPPTKETTSSLMRLVQWNAGIRPGPVRPPVPQLSVQALRVSQRSQRSVPSTPLFEVQPWTLSAASHTQGTD